MFDSATAPIGGISLTKDGQRLSALERELSWLRRKLGRALKYIEDNEHIEKSALTFARHVREKRPDLPKFTEST
jgi:hypothetical protein